MEKIKNMLRPGANKDDETMYGDNAGHSTNTTGTHASDSTDTHTGRAVGSGTQADSTGYHESGQKEHGIMRQIFNPAGDKYDEQAYGAPTGTAATSTVGGSGRKHSAVDLDNVDQLRTDPGEAKNDHGVLRQIMNPHGGKYDNQAYGVTAKEVGSEGVPQHSGEGQAQLYTNPGAAQKDHGVLRQIVNPGGDKYEETRYGSTAIADAPLDATTTGNAGSIAPLPARIETTEAAEKDHGILRQLVNPGGERRDDMRYGETGIAAQGSDQATSNDSHLGRDAALGGAAVAGVGAAGYEADQHPRGIATSAAQPASSITYPATATAVSDAAVHQTTDRSFPLAGGTTVTTGSALPDRTAQTSMTGDSTHQNVALGSGVGATSGAGLGAYEQSLEPKQDVSDAAYAYGSQPVGSGVGGHRDNEEPVPGYIHQTHGPHATDAANMLDPHVPGEFPAEPPEDRHDLGNREAAIIGGTGVTGTDVAVLETGKAPEQLSNTSSSLPRTTAYTEPAVVPSPVPARGVQEPIQPMQQPIETVQQPVQVVQQPIQPIQPVQQQQPAYIAPAPSAAPLAVLPSDAYESMEKPAHSDSPKSTEHSHNKLHKKQDPRGPTGASNVIQDRHEHKLQEAREAEAAKAHEHADKEKKPSLIQRILHPGQHKHDQSATEGSTMSPQDTETPTSRTHVGNDPYQTSAAPTTAMPVRSMNDANPERQGVVYEPHTGLPMNVDTYGSGQGGTDAAQNIGGYHEHASGEGSADWDRIKKANTPY